MFKKRPRVSGPVFKLVPAYWRARLFKNTFTYKGRSVEVSCWSVKIQLAGQRKTFSLKSGNPTQAAKEACGIYQTIRTHGWAAVALRGAITTGQLSEPTGETNASLMYRTDAEHWRRRLIHRNYLERPNAPADREFSARIEHGRRSHYFPLGTSDEAAAARQARRIYQTVIHDGWATAMAAFPREVTLALRWLDNPLAWTYTTLHTAKPSGSDRPAVESPRPLPGIGVAIIEPDDGIRRALAACANSQTGFRCEVTFASAREALREIPRHRLHLILANHILPDRLGALWLEELAQITPRSAGIVYSVYRDSDELFRAAPGGAVGYLLKRTLPRHLFEPLAGAVGPLTREAIAACIREYFQNLLTALPVGPSSPELAKLTAREHEILTLLSQGAVAKEIASTLGISRWTVQGHVKNIFEKLNVHTRTEAVVKFLQK